MGIGIGINTDVGIGVPIQLINNKQRDYYIIYLINLRQVSSIIGSIIGGKNSSGS